MEQVMVYKKITIFHMRGEGRKEEKGASPEEAMWDSLIFPERILCTRAVAPAGSLGIPLAVSDPCFLFRRIYWSGSVCTDCARSILCLI
jgi:hypothetical protein